MSLIDHTNFAANLKESTTARGSTPDGNVFFDVANNQIQLIWRHQQATVDFGSGPVPNPLVFEDGVTMRALYNFENSRRRVNETLRKYLRGVDGSYRFAGAYNFVNGVKLSVADVDDRKGIRGSGFVEYAAIGTGATAIDRVYHGVLSLNPIRPTTVSYYALVSDQLETTLQAATWTNFGRQGPINEVVQVMGTTANGDLGAGNFDYRTRVLVGRVRSWTYNPGETTSLLSGLSEFSGFSSGYGVGETLNTNNTYDIADVYGGAAITPFTGMSLEKLAVPAVEGGFNQAAGNFTWVLHNTAGGNVLQCAAFLDALSLQDTDIDSSGTTAYNGKKGRVWYNRNSEGQVVTSSIGGSGLFIENLSPAEGQKIVFTDDSGAAKTRPYFPTVEITVGAVAVSDPNAWYRVIYKNGAGAADFDTAGAVTVNDASGTPVNGNVAADASGVKIIFSYAYDTNTQAGLAAGIDKEMVVLVEGDGVAAQARADFTVTRTTLIAVACSPALDNNA